MNWAQVYQRSAGTFIKIRDKQFYNPKRPDWVAGLIIGFAVVKRNERWKYLL
jgi:hypothetical protein